MQPIVLDNLCTGNRFALRYGPFYEGSIADQTLVSNICNRHRPMGAMLFAGHAYVGESTGNPRKYFHNNISQAISFLDALIDAGVKSVVFSSSCSVYGSQKRMPIREDCPPSPLSPYAETKLFLEKVLEWYASAYAIRYACLRYFNAAGADPDGELGEHHDPETHLIPLAIHAATSGAPLRVFGDDYPTPDGTAIRDYVHVTDLAAAHLKALNYLLEGRPSITLNLGTGNGHSVKQVIDAVERESGTPVPVQYVERRQGDAPILIADPRYAAQVLAWHPQHSTLETIVRTAWRWHSRPAWPTSHETQQLYNQSLLSA